MKRKILCTLALLTIALTGVAWATGGTSGDPLITLDYLLDTFFPQLTTAVEEQVEENMVAVDDALYALLDEKNAALVGTMGGEWTSTSASDITQINRGDVLELSTGTDVTFYQGSATVTVSGGSLVDVTSGTAATGTVTLVANHRYLVGESATAEMTSASDTSYLDVQGYYIYTDGGVDVLPFVDINGDAWYYDYVHYVYQQGLFQGVTDTTFAPTSSMTRAMLATVLYRLAGTPSVVGGQVTFADVADSVWYAEPVLWAASEGIVNGMGEGIFNPDGNVTREQMAVMLYRYATSYLNVTAATTGDLTVFSDSGSISSWATEAISWAVGAGIISGRTDGALDPDGTATRAEVATMLQRFSNFLP